VSDDDAHLEGADATAHEVMEVLWALNKDSLEVAASRSREGTEADTEDSGDEGGSESSTGEALQSESDAMRKAKVAAASATGLTFEFSPCTIVRGQMRAMEDLGYFAKGGGMALGVEMVPESRIDEVVVFEDLFIARLHILRTLCTRLWWIYR
jgi:hypothetical protein